MDCPTRRRKNSISSEEELRKMSRVSWIQDPKGTNLQQQQQQLLDHQMTVRFQHQHQQHQQQQQQQQNHHHHQQQQQQQHQQQQQQQQLHHQQGDQIPVAVASSQAGATTALNFQQRAMAAIALQEIRSSIDPSKLVPQHHKFHQPASSAAAPQSIPVLHCIQQPMQQSIHQQQQQNPSFNTNNPLSVLDTRSLYPSSMLPMSPLTTPSSGEVSQDPNPVTSSKMMMPYPQLMMNIPPVIFPPSLITSSSSSARIPPSTPPPPPPPAPPATKPMPPVPMSSMNAVPDFKDLQQQQHQQQQHQQQQQQQALRSSPATTTATSTKWFSSPPPFQQQQQSGALAATLAGPGTGIWRGTTAGDFSSGVGTGLDQHEQHEQQQHQHHHHHLHPHHQHRNQYQQELENSSVILQQQDPAAPATSSGAFGVPSVTIGSSMMMPPSGSFRSSSISIQQQLNSAVPLSPAPPGVDQVIADLKNIVSSSSPDSCVVTENPSRQLKSIVPPQQQQQQHLQQQQQQFHPRQRTFTKVYKLGSIGRAVDVARFKNYVELRAELSRMFGLDGQLDQRNGWQLVFVDKENDLLLVGDDPWEEFVRSVRGIRILSPSEVSYYTSDERSAEVV